RQRRPQHPESRRLLRRDLLFARRGAGCRHRGANPAALSRAAGRPARGISDGASTNHVPPAAGGGAQAQEHNQVAELGQKPFPPGRYRLIVVGSGPGGLQLSYSLTRLGIDHALLSDDPAPGGMFRRWPVFQRMLSWTKPFAGGGGQGGGQDFLLITSDGEYRAPIVVFAVGVAHPYRPPIPGLESVPHYGDFRPVESYKDRRVFIVGKQNSGFEIATGLLPWARQLVLASPSPAKLSVITHTLVGVRARYVQPYEDAALAGGVVIL